jgi:hypothetical protein
MVVSQISPFRNGSLGNFSFIFIYCGSIARKRHNHFIRSALLTVDNMDGDSDSLEASDLVALAEATFLAEWDAPSSDSDSNSSDPHPPASQVKPAGSETSTRSTGEESKLM